MLVENYHAGNLVAVDFTKANGEKRHMLVQKNDSLLSAVAGARHFSNPNVLRVTELLDDGTSQWRSIPLDRLISVDVAAPF